MAADAVGLHPPARSHTADYGRPWKASKRKTGRSGLSPQVRERESLEVVPRPAVLARAERRVTVKPEEHAGLAPLADSLARLDREGCRQRNRPGFGRVVVGDDDPVRLHPLDDLRGIKRVHDIEHLGLLQPHLPGPSTSRAAPRARKGARAQWPTRARPPVARSPRAGCAGTSARAARSSRSGARGSARRPDSAGGRQPVPDRSRTGAGDLAIAFRQIVSRSRGILSLSCRGGRGSSSRTC